MDGGWVGDDLLKAVCFDTVAFQRGLKGVQFFQLDSFKIKLISVLFLQIADQSFVVRPPVTRHWDRLSRRLPSEK